VRVEMRAGVGLWVGIEGTLRSWRPLFLPVTGYGARHMFSQWLNQRNKRSGKPAPSLVLYQRVALDEI
jgi:hypothetical protein